jgi:ubiquinone/menaquinone biosynthesis C-methylase UbiE
LKEKPPGAGGSSFQLVDFEKVVVELDLQKGATFLDMACGNGEYALRFSKIIGDEGLIYAVDLWEDNINRLIKTLSAAGIKNIEALVADVSEPMPIGNDSIDICLMATVLHDLIQANTAEGAIKEAARVLKPHGLLAIIEFKKVDGPPGPPIHIRLRPQDVESIVEPFGFNKKGMKEVGAYNYLMAFHLEDIKQQFFE